MSSADSLDWARERWDELGGPDPDRFAAMVAVFRVSALVGSTLDRTLKGQDLSRTAYLVLATLRIHRDRTLTMSQLSRNLILHPTTISLVVDQLQGRGFVDRRPHPSDRRTVLATLTPTGRKALDAANKALSDVGFGLGGVTDRLAITLTEVIRQVRAEIGDD
jgi:DNA-binding MarR family transcriptional regulator